MIDKQRLTEAVIKYKQAFATDWFPKEKYKWEAIQCFQDNWNIDAADFSEMLERSLSETNNLLASMNNFPKRMILQFANFDPKSVRQMYRELYDESTDLTKRIQKFKSKAEKLRQKYRSDAGNHYQNENSITTYLWLKYPDKYYIFKYSEAKNVAVGLNSNYDFKKGAYAENVKNGYALYEEVRTNILHDTDLANMFIRQLDKGMYPDSALKTLTMDLCYYISRKIVKSDDMEEWIPENYEPNITAETWKKLLKDESVFTRDSVDIITRIREMGGQATCVGLANKYGNTVEFYRNGSVTLAKRVQKKTDCAVAKREDGSIRWWAVLYMGRKTENEEAGTFMWKLRDELIQALDSAETSAGRPEGEMQYWWVNCNPKIWSFSNLSVGDVQWYHVYNKNGNPCRVHQNFIDIKVGDKIIGYESSPVRKIVALGEVCKKEEGEKVYFKKTETIPSPIDYQTLKEYKELENMEYLRSPQGSLFKLTKAEYEFILDLILEENPQQGEEENEKYSKERFLKDVYLSGEQYEELVSVLKIKQNLILQGAPGVGKTWAAKRLAYTMMGEMDNNRIKLVQFHQNYSYEDFIMGYKPDNNGFELKPGIFYTFCKEAENHPEKDYFFIIDEINRGNMSKIFGELLSRIETEYRGEKVTLAYNDELFSVPKNLYIIGMMNTADRSLAMIDYALRRRFSFFDMEPAFASPGFVAYRDSLGKEQFNKLIETIEDLNVVIGEDKTLGKGFCIGHSYFCNLVKDTCTAARLREIVKYDILPMLKEYWFDDDDKYETWASALKSVV